MYLPSLPGGLKASCYFRSVKLWWLLDVASVDGPDWSEEGTDVGELGYLESRQLGGVLVYAVSWTVVEWGRC